MQTRESQIPIPGNADRDGATGEPSLSCAVPLSSLDFGTYNDSNIDAESVLATCGGNGRGAERVFAFTTEMDARVFIDTSGSTFDTVLAIRTECESIESELSCDDDGGDSFQSRVEFFARQGVDTSPLYMALEKPTRCDSIDLWDSQ